ncbi:Alpha/beta knot methyltransferase [Dunaliella salina]|uniref:Alpha/beta knot methyltransferase n=1 Tax=Dunaliella salina TaxID=3046 RepID=A0ABQ7H669_DUNSA|nr:Alpha/beta knot methyltransferase [Dunaliella salina]|eukprot:KAF5842358.1 Alpha/beta knot methyltransferase [Dunaliella salina]
MQQVARTKATGACQPFSGANRVKRHAGRPHKQGRQAAPEAFSDAPPLRQDLNIVLVNPQIPQNTGNACRTAAATGVPMHLVGPLGFSTDDSMLKRAGLDYWHAVCVQTHESWESFHNFFLSLPDPKRLVAFTVYGSTSHHGLAYQPGDWLVFGSEVSGLSPQAHDDIKLGGGALVKIPIRDTYVRSLNLATSVGIGTFEALRQLDADKPDIVYPRASPSWDEVVAKHFTKKE